MLRQQLLPGAPDWADEEVRDRKLGLLHRHVTDLGTSTVSICGDADFTLRLAAVVGLSAMAGDGRNWRPCKPPAARGDTEQRSGSLYMP
jgi:hypothetical protein